MQVATVNNNAKSIVLVNFSISALALQTVVANWTVPSNFIRAQIYTKTLPVPCHSHRIEQPRTNIPLTLCSIEFRFFFLAHRIPLHFILVFLSHLCRYSTTTTTTTTSGGKKVATPFYNAARSPFGSVVERNGLSSVPSN